MTVRSSDTLSPSPVPSPIPLAPHGILAPSDVRDADVLMNIVNELRTIEVDFSVREHIQHGRLDPNDPTSPPLQDIIKTPYHLALIFEGHQAFMAFRAKIDAAFHLYDLAYAKKQREDQIATTALLLNIPHDTVRVAMDTPWSNICDECGGTGPSNVPRPPNLYRASDAIEYERISIRTIGLITHEPHFYHPSCAAEYSWLTGEVLEGIVPPATEDTLRPAPPLPRPKESRPS